MTSFTSSPSETQNLLFDTTQGELTNYDAIQKSRLSNADIASALNLSVDIEDGSGHGGHIYTEPPPGYDLHSIGALFRAGYKSEEQLQKITSEPLREFYADQNELLQECLAAMHEHPCVSRDDYQFLRSRVQTDSGSPDAAVEEQRVRRAIIWSNIGNVILLTFQFISFSQSGSLSILAVFVDAVLDMVSGLVVLFTWSTKNRRDAYRYPVGRMRLEPLGVIGLACLMTAATLLTLEQSILSLTQGEGEQAFKGLSVTVGTILLSSLFVKFLLYLYCSRIDSISVQGLSEDHFNDCISNSVSFCTVLFAQHTFWWIDPLGGILLSLMIIRNWIVHTLEHCDQLLGKVAGRKVTNVITFVACNHSPEILLVDTVRAYHVGNGIYAEVDIVLAEDMRLIQAHDVGESLQTRIETLEGVERCFVHIDTEVSHSPATEHKVL